MLGLTGAHRALSFTSKRGGAQLADGDVWQAGGGVGVASGWGGENAEGAGANNLAVKDMPMI